jgi:hypothetical protein
MDARGNCARDNRIDELVVGAGMAGLAAELGAEFVHALPKTMWNLLRDAKVGACDAWLIGSTSSRKGRAMNRMLARSAAIAKCAARNWIADNASTAGASLAS